MKIIIDIPDAQYDNLVKIVIAGEEPLGCFERVIMRGIPLPKHHGRLIDADELKTYADSRWSESASDGYEYYVEVSDIDNAPTIIEGSESE